MRFAFKTAPQNTTWRDMLAVWQEADDIELFESGWTFDHFYPIFSDSAAQAERLVAWTAPWLERTWAVEGAGGLGYVLAQQLVAAERARARCPAQARRPGAAARDRGE
jgi:hypothetical protein